MRSVVMWLAFTTLVTTGATANALDPGGTFLDDDHNIHEGNIEAIAADGITRGCNPPDNDHFCPNKAVSRGEMAAFLTRAFGYPPGPDRFTDDEDVIFEADINALAAAGVTKGCNPPDNDRYCPARAVSRGEMAALLTRAFGYPPGPDRFTDDEDLVFEADINALAAAGVTYGCNPPDNDRYCPRDPVRRDQMASFLARAFHLEPLVPPPRPSFTIAFTGDLLLHMPVNDAAAAYGRSSGTAYDFDPMFEPVRAALSRADVAICHLEVPLSPTSTGLSGYPTFLGPAELADDIRDAGYDGCSVASNHSYDRGASGVTDTLDVLDAAGVASAGMARSAAEDDTVTTYEAEGASIAHLSYTYGLNGFVLPADRTYLVDLIDRDTILAEAAQARQAGADVVIVSLHWGAEYRTEPTTAQTSLGRALIASDDIDLVVGHHAHVVQPIEEIDGEYIIYGLGNFLSNQRWSLPTQDGVIVTVEFVLHRERWIARTVTYTPTWVESNTYRILPAATSIAGAPEWEQSALRASWTRTDRAINLFGADIEPTARP